MAAETTSETKPTKTVDETIDDVEKKRKDGNLTAASDALRDDWMKWAKDNQGQDPSKFWAPVEQRLGPQVLQELSLVQAQQEGRLTSPADSTRRLTDAAAGRTPLSREGNTPEAEFGRRMDAYLQKALENPAFKNQLHGRDQVTVGDVNERIALLNRANATGGEGELKLSRDDAKLLMDLLGNQPSLRNRLFKGTSVSDELDDRKMSKQDAERIAKMLPEGHPLRKELEKLTKEWPKENGQPITYRELRERAAGTDTPAKPAETPAETEQRETAERKQRAQDTVKQMLGLSPEATDKLFPSKDKDGNPIKREDREMTRDSVRATLDDPNSNLSKEQRDHLQKLYDQWPDKDKDGNPKPMKMGDVLKDAGYGSNGDDGKPDGNVNWGKFDMDQRARQQEAKDLMERLDKIDLSKIQVTDDKGPLITRDSINKRLKELDPNSDEAKTLNDLLKNFDKFSKNGSFISADDMADYKKRNGLDKPADKPETLDPKTEKEIRDRIAAFEALPTELRLTRGQSSFEAVRDYYLKRAAITGEPTDVRSQREFYLKVLERNGIKIPPHLAEKYMRDGSPSHLPREINGQIKSVLKLTDDNDQQQSRQRIADRQVPPMERVMNMTPQQVTAVRAEQERLTKSGAPAERTTFAAVVMRLSQDPETNKSLWPKPITEEDIKVAFVARAKQVALARRVAEDESEKRKRPAAAAA